MKKIVFVPCLLSFVLPALAAFEVDRSAMSDAYWKIWNDAEQARIDADIEANRKADAVIAIAAADGEDVKIEQLDHEFRFGAHIFNFNQLGSTANNNAYKASYGRGGIFNQATVAFYWKDYEPVPGRLRSGGDYEDTERFWNSLSYDEAMGHPFWRRPAAGPVIDFLKAKDVRIHGHILIWGLAKPEWIYDWYCPENEKRAFDRFGIPRHATQLVNEEAGWTGGYNRLWRNAWDEAYKTGITEQELATLAPTFTKNMRRLFRKRVFDVAGAFAGVVDSWDVVNESSHDWTVYRKSRTGLPVWKSGYGLMPGDYPLHALLDCKEAFPATTALAINDYNICEDFLSQVKDLEKEGAKIDIVGCQMHIFDTNACMRLAKGDDNIAWVGTPKTIQDRLDMMAKTGKRLHVSEITITSPGADERSRMIQAILTRNIYRKWFSHKALMGITWWNTVDGGGVKGEPLVSGLFTRDLKKKPAYLALDALINHEWMTKTSAKAKDGFVSFRGFRGKYRVSWKCPKCSGRHSREFYLTDNGCVEQAPYAVKDGDCVAVVRDYTVDGKRVTLGDDERYLDLAKLYPDGTGKGTSEGSQWAEVSFQVKAPKAGTYELLRFNDYFGEIAVNDGALRKADGPWRGEEKTPVDLKAGENVIRLRTRGGSSGKWACGFRFRASTGLSL